MADILDDADRAAEAFHREALSRRRPAGPPSTGVCLNCEAPLPEPHRFCDGDCRDDFEHRNAQRRA